MGGTPQPRADAPIMVYDNPENPFQGWSVVTCGCAAVGALGGVLVALSIKYVRAERRANPPARTGNPPARSPTDIARR
jgi:hypothetical protein